MWRNRSMEENGERTLIRNPQSDTTSEGYESMQGSDRPLTSEHLNNSSEAGYTELMRGSVPCPTCKGIGNVPKEQESQLIALIPLKDKRLQPSRTHLWVGLAVLLCVATAGLLVFFMFPRDVTLSSKRPYLNPLGTVYVNTSTQTVNFIVSNYVQVENQNYVPTKVTKMKVTALYDTQVLAETENNTAVSIPIKSSRELSVNINITLDEENHLGYMARQCDDPIRWIHEMVMIFEFTCFYNFLGRSEQTTLQVFQYVSCYSVTTTTPKPTTTTTTPTTTHQPNTTDIAR